VKNAIRGRNQRRAHLEGICAVVNCVLKSIGLTLLLIGNAHAEQHLVTPKTDLKKLCQKVVAGDSIVLQNGDWRDVELEFSSLYGTPESPISIVAETLGEVVLSGKIQLRVSGEHVVVSGLVFRDCVGVDNVLELRSDDELPAEHCRVTNCVFDQPKAVESNKETTWLAVYGSNHRIDHCYFGGKKTRGATIVIWVGEEPEDHRVDHNYFGPRPKLGQNGGETIRIGSSKDSEFVCKTIVEENYFFKCDGEAELISNKSCENIYRHNVVEECSGALTLRHGHRCLVDGNVFLGNEQAGTGGVRIIGRGHRVINNYFEGLRGDAERATICLMNGIPDSPLNGFAPVEDAIVAHNTFVDCKVTFEIGVGSGTRKRSVAPKKCLFANNVISSGKWTPFRLHADPVEFVCRGNKQQIGRDYDDMPIDFERVALRLTRTDDHLMRPLDSQNLKTDALSELEIKLDIDGQPRSETAVAGCDDPENELRELASRRNTGPEWRRVSNQ
jgi:poly(beta-D-mannuronate) lyase